VAGAGGLGGSQPRKDGRVPLAMITYDRSLLITVARKALYNTKLPGQERCRPVLANAPLQREIFRHFDHLFRPGPLTVMSSVMYGRNITYMKFDWGDRAAVNILRHHCRCVSCFCIGTLGQLNSQIITEIAGRCHCSPHTHCDCFLFCTLFFCFRFTQTWLSNPG
jgi:hypothetical protein